ncbi:MAG: hypothetical protein GX857_02800, partial [Bacteroidales bacterium]|nr:hypothetical protein [Bacteroidales bacterium]
MTKWHFTHIQTKHNLKNYKQISRRTWLLFCLSMLFFTNTMSQNPTDSALYSRPYIYQLGIEARPGYIFRINPFLKGENKDGEPIKHLYST